MGRSKKIMYFISVMIIMAILSTTVMPIMAASTEKNISAYFSNIKIYVDDVLIQPKDVAGNIIEPFVYNGTTYLPVRAMAEAFGKNVVWEGKTNSVYLGEHDSEIPVANLAEMEYFYANKPASSPMHSEIIKGAGVKDNIGNMHTKGFRLCNLSSSETNQKVYLINQQYSTLKGMVALNYESRDNTNGIGVRLYGDDRLLYESPVMIAGSYPEAFEADVSGVVQLKLEWYSPSASSNPYLILSGLDFYQ